MGNYLLYYLFLKPLSLCPFWVLYRVSDTLYYITFYLIKYRKKIVYENLINSFPDKSAKEIEVIAKEFYSHFCDLMVESLKFISMKEEELHKRYKVLNKEILIPFAEQNKNLIITAGHYANWEWHAVSLPSHNKNYLVLGIYKPLTNPFFNKLMFDSRSKTGMKLIAAPEVTSTYKNLTENNTLHATCIFTDQAPSNPLKCYWTTFLNQDTPVLFGTEKYAKEFNYAVLFADIRKVKRGHYTIKYKVLVTEPQLTKKYEITEAHTRALEEAIIEEPAYWLWSHKRWKHKRPENWKP
ncbi:MAG: lysophospholipid acyltransferase family protein [Bacteroidota bacterium]